MRKLTDGYIAQLFGIPLKELKKYPELIECKRVNLMIKREVKRQEGNPKYQ